MDSGSGDDARKVCRRIHRRDDGQNMRPITNDGARQVQALDQTNGGARGDIVIPNISERILRGGDVVQDHLADRHLYTVGLDLLHLD